MKIFLAFFLAVVLLLFFQFSPAKEVTWGLNYSILQAQFLGLDWQKNFREVLTDFRPKILRIPVYWQTVERERGKFNFADYDYLLGEARKNGAKVILVIGLKQPRWPECHEPEWVRNQKLNIKSQKVLEYIREVVLHYRNNTAVKYWQIENEPFFEYGPNCPKISRDFYQQELALVKSLDLRPIVVTDSGEKGAWLPVAMSGGEIFGSTMYRKVYHHQKHKYIRYPIPPQLYRFKAGVVKTFTKADRFIGVELQAEPWFSTDPYHTPWPEQAALMNPEVFWEYIDYARRVGFAENYLWGVEWWYWARNLGHPEMWEAARKIINN